MNKFLWVLFLFVLFLSIILTFRSKIKKVTQKQKPIPIRKIQQIPQKTKPEFTEYKPLRNVNDLGEVLSDIESHMPAGHIYKDKDKITWAHETSHGIHSHLRQKFFTGEKINGFYVLKDRAVIIKEPNTTIQSAARLVPYSLRGDVYNLYMVQQARNWGNTPLYVFDEWVAYSNGAACRLNLGITNRSETVLYMLEFNVYSICVAMAANTEDKQFKNFLIWHSERTMHLYEQNKKLGGSFLDKQSSYLNKIRTSPDAEEIRSFCRNYFGKQWTLKILGF